MNTEVMKAIIRDQREEIQSAFAKGGMIERDVPVQKLDKYLSRPNILAILGVRRCGKSVLSHMLMGGRKYGYINFDDERLLGLGAKDMNQALEALYGLYGEDLDYVVLDEIQNVPGWELFASRLRRTKRVILTGSNAKLLSGELATHLTGRYADFTLYPFSFSEFLSLKAMPKEAQSTKDIARIKAAFREYMNTGGFPEAHTFGKEVPARIYDDILHKDIILRHRVRNAKNFLELARYMISNFSCEFTYNKLKNVVSVKDNHTIKDYMDYLESAYLLFVTERFSYKLKEQMMAPKKVYCIDTGIIGGVAFKSSDDAGRLMENIVAVELYRRRASHGGRGGGRTGIYYWKDHQQREVDFVLKDGSAVNELIQVSYASSEKDLKARELDALVRASKELRCKNLTIITWEFEEKVHGARCVPIWKWIIADKEQKQ